MKIKDLDKDTVRTILKKYDRLKYAEIFQDYCREKSEYTELLYIVAQEMSESMADVISTKNSLYEVIGKENADEMLSLIFKYFNEIADAMEMDVSEIEKLLN